MSIFDKVFAIAESQGYDLEQIDKIRKKSKQDAMVTVLSVLDALVEILISKKIITDKELLSYMTRFIFHPKTNDMITIICSECLQDLFKEDQKP